MAAERWQRALLLLLALAVLVADIDAQGRRPRRAGRTGRGGAAEFNGFAPLGPEGPASPKAGRAKAGGKKPAPKKPPATPAKAAKKPAPAKPEAPKPSDPMQAADEVTAAADHANLIEESRARLLREHFRLCDLDGNSWISLREAEFVLGLARADYQRMDANQDGRLDGQEFQRNRERILARLGACVPEKPAPDPSVEDSGPAPEEESPSPETHEGETIPESQPPAPVAAASNAVSRPADLRMRPGKMLSRFDEDHSMGLGLPEVGKLLSDAGLTLSSEQVVESMDRNDSGQLEGGELLALAWLAAEHWEGDVAPEAPGSMPPELPAEPPEPSRARALGEPRGRPSHFQRLDPDHDGFLSEADLRLLQGSTRLELRLRALLSALDQDGDGRLCASEFDASMARATEVP
jgi:Ca2+-binding EF-hand superfamily protein